METKRLRYLLYGLSFVPILLTTAAMEAEVSGANWTQLLPTTSPTARSYLAMAYDAARNKVLLFGGFGAAGYLNDTWIFDGATWTKVDTAIAPGPRSNAQMAYDRRTRKVVLFGGYDGTHYLGDTWLWDGTTSTWTQAAPPHSPKAVTGTMVFTDFDGRVDEFGGFDGSLYQLTMWQWSGLDWRKLHPSQVPFARSSAAVGVDYRGRLGPPNIVLYGGLGDVNPLNTWTYDGRTWTMQSPANQPLTVYGASAVFDPNLDAVVVFGGADGGVAQDRTWSWTDSNWEQVITAQSPGAREGAGIAYDVALGSTVIFGGENRGVTKSDTWELSP